MKYNRKMSSNEILHYAFLESCDVSKFEIEHYDKYHVFEQIFHEGYNEGHNDGYQKGFEEALKVAKQNISLKNKILTLFSK